MTAQIPLPRDETPSDRTAANVQLWSNFLRTLYGPTRGAEIGGLGSLALPELLLADSVLREQVVARPAELRKLLTPLLLASAGAKDASPELRELVFAAVRDLDPVPATFADAVARLCDGAVRPSPNRLRRTARSASRLLDPEVLLEIEPGYIRREGAVFVVGRRVRCKASLVKLRDVLDPRGWKALGTFFEYAAPVENEYEVREDGSGWHGLYEERFSVGWSALRINSFHPFLQVDFTYDALRVRTDYSLVYEEHGQLECDDGFIEARSIPGRLGWCEYVAEKGLKFRSPAMDLLAPTVTAVFLDNFLVAIEDAADETGGGSP